LSDSGGYQVYSLIHRAGGNGVVTDTGVRFRSVYDGAWHMLTPERAITIQAVLGTDMMVVLDDPRPNNASRVEFTQAVERTVMYAERCRRTYARLARQYRWTQTRRPLLFAVIQGGPYADLRAQCAAALHDVARRVDNGFSIPHWDGMGFGGRHVDTEGNFMHDAMAQTAALIPSPSIAFALGVGTPADIVRSVACGWELFDCVIPTREGRHGRIFVLHQDGESRVRQALHSRTAEEFYTVENLRTAANRYDKRLLCVPTAARYSVCYSRAYVHHLMRSEDPLGAQIAARHNLVFYDYLMRTLGKII